MCILNGAERAKTQVLPELVEIKEALFLTRKRYLFILHIQTGDKPRGELIQELYPTLFPRPDFGIGPIEVAQFEVKGLLEGIGYLLDFNIAIVDHTPMV